MSKVSSFPLKKKIIYLTSLQTRKHNSQARLNFYCAYALITRQPKCFQFTSSFLHLLEQMWQFNKGKQTWESYLDMDKRC